MRAEQRPPHAAAQQLAHARPTTPRHPPTNPLAAPSSGAHVPLTVGTRAVVLVASCGTRTRSAARAIEQRVRSAWRASAMRAQQHQPCGALSWSRRRTHGCRKQLRVSGRREQLRRSQLVHAVSPTSTTRVSRGCGGQARAAAGAPAPCSASAHVRPPPQQAAPAATHVCSRTHDLRMRERPIETPHRRVWPNHSAPPSDQPSRRTVQRRARAADGGHKGGGARRVVRHTHSLRCACDRAARSLGVEGVCDACSAAPAVRRTLMEPPTHARLPQAAAGERPPRAAAAVAARRSDGAIRANTVGQSGRSDSSAATPFRQALQSSRCPFRRSRSRRTRHGGGGDGTCIGDLGSQGSQHARPHATGQHSHTPKCKNARRRPASEGTSVHPRRRRPTAPGAIARPGSSGLSLVRGDLNFSCMLEHHSVR